MGGLGVARMSINLSICDTINSVEYCLTGWGFSMSEHELDR